MPLAKWNMGGSLLIAVFSLCGCAPLGMTALGVGSSTAVSHTMGGITYRTFTAPRGKVKNATLVALNRMDIKVLSTEKDDVTETLYAKTSGRSIEIQLEPLTPNTTRMRVTAKSNGIFYDSATSTEIILQTERVMGRNA